MWPKCCKISHFHHHFKTPYLESCTRLKRPKVPSQRVPGQSPPPLHCFLNPGLLLTPLNIHEPLKTNCTYWAMCLLHSLVPPDRVVDEKEGEEVLNIIHSSWAALPSPQRLIQEENVALSLSMATMALKFFGCLCPVCSSEHSW